MIQNVGECTLWTEGMGSGPAKTTIQPHEIKKVQPSPAAETRKLYQNFVTIHKG